MYYIYKIENLINKKKYIGLTCNIKRRRARHFSDLRRNQHDNSFLQKEFNIFGEENFDFNIEFEGDVSYQEISNKEKYFISLYDSYRNGYNQNEGGNFGPSNGGSHLTENEILSILSVLEFFPNRPGQVLSDIFHVSKTTIHRIKIGENHTRVKSQYEKTPETERLALYNNFCKDTDFLRKREESSKLESKRKLSKQQVFLVLLNHELKILTQKEMIKRLNIKSTYTIGCILKGKTYQNYSREYSQLTKDQKRELATLLRNQY